MSDPLPLPLGQRCGRRTRSGAPCRQWAIRGGTVCKMHGGMAPQVRASAAARLRSLQHTAVSAMEQLVGGAESEQVRLAAAKAILDYSGMAAEQKLDVTSGGAALRIVIASSPSPAPA